MSLSTLVRAAAAAPLALVALAAPAAQAVAPDERGRYDDTESFTRVLCGRSWDVTSRDSGRFQVRASEDGAPEVFVHDVHRFARTYVAGNGDTYNIAGKENFRIADVERVEGDLWSIEVVVSGRSWALSSASGKLIWADRGIFRTHVLVDTQGDDDPSNDEYDVSFDWAGPHFVSDTQPGSQYCELVDRAIAAG